MKSRFSRTEVIDGEPIVTLFVTGVKCLDRQVEMLDELLRNAGTIGEIGGPASRAKESLLVLRTAMNLPSSRTRETPEKV